MFKKIHVFRVMPHQELCGDNCLLQKHNITSGVIFGIIGSVTKARLNFLLKIPRDFKRWSIGSDGDCLRTRHSRPERKQPDTSHPYAAFQPEIKREDMYLRPLYFQLLR